MLHPQQITGPVGWYRAFCWNVVSLTAAECASFCCRLLIAASVHMSCCGEWVGPVEHTIISCLGRILTAQARYLAGPCRKGPDNNLQTKTMRHKSGIIPGSSGNNIYSCVLVFSSQFLPSYPDPFFSHTSLVYVMLWVFIVVNFMEIFRRIQFFGRIQSKQYDWTERV